MGIEGRSPRHAASMTRLGCYTTSDWASSATRDAAPVVALKPPPGRLRRQAMLGADYNLGAACTRSVVALAW